MMMTEAEEKEASGAFWQRNLEPDLFGGFMLHCQPTFQLFFWFLFLCFFVITLLVENGFFSLFFTSIFLSRIQHTHKGIR